MTKSVSIFASGSGSIAEALYLKALENPEIVTVKNIICDVKDAGIFGRFEKYELTPTLIERCNPREAHEAKILEALDGIDYIFLAGYMRILTPEFINRFKNRIINIHPSMLPKHKGTQGYKDTFENESEGGITIHYVTADLDAGPIIKQITFPKKNNDTLETFTERGKTYERKIYSETFIELLRQA